MLVLDVCCTCLMVILDFNYYTFLSLRRLFLWVRLFHLSGQWTRTSAGGRQRAPILRLILQRFPWRGDVGLLVLRFLLSVTCNVCIFLKAHEIFQSQILQFFVLYVIINVILYSIGKIFILLFNCNIKVCS